MLFFLLWKGLPGKNKSAQNDLYNDGFNNFKTDKMKILCIGEALIDMICTDAGSSLSEGEHFLKKPGGAPTNVAAAIAALGGDVLLAAKVGDDPFGQHLINVMNGFGVSTKWMLRDKNHFTTFAFVSLMKDGEGNFVFNRGADGQLNEKDIEGIDLDECSIIHFGSARAFLPGPLQKAYQTLLRKAREKNIFISFDPNYRHLLFKNNTASFIQQSWNYLHQCRFFKLSDEEAMLLTESSSVYEAAKMLSEKLNATFVITLGKGITVESIIINSIDSTGAGDAFVGAVLYQRSKYPLSVVWNLSEEEWKSIVYFANKAGARTCEYFGAMESFTHLNEGLFD